MADTFARMRQLIGSTAEWTANDIVLGYGEIGVERASAAEYKVKVGDGSAKWSALPYISAGSGSINTAIQTALDAKLPIAGGTMTGNLFLARDGLQPKEAATYGQLQAAITQLNTAVAAKLASAGGTMTGPLVLSADATQPKEAVTYSQLTTAISNVVISAGGSLVFTGTVDATTVYAVPTPAPTATGQFYTATQSGTISPTWHSHIANSGNAVSAGDYFVWNATDNKYYHISNAVDLTAYVPLAGTNGMTGNIVWSGVAGNKTGATIISGKGGAIDEIVIDGGNF